MPRPFWLPIIGGWGAFREQYLTWFKENWNNGF